ncbi:PREDICTED: mucin-19-like isoform X2 [Vollenhovia emeryi]|uniref:mucin-19-like isoform X2 n=1 Tax=Vollenhovia emeryi TaxID=411798 RepID=UPI0005F454DC|nr:PREDICTED: mucin-19-like isoform X2 [Vollenhovia emeryi]
MWGRVLLVSFALIALGTAKCPRRKTSPVREILCYTSTFDAQLLAGSVCSCTTLVHQNHDVRNLSISDIADLRKSLKEMHPPLQFVISIYDPAMTLRNSATVRQEAIARIIAVMKEVDGVEMNVTAGSKERLYNFVKSLKDEMIRKSYDKRIFMALSSRSEDLAKQFDIKELIKYIDLFTLPTDYMTDEDGAYVTFHPSRLMGLFDMLNTDSLIDLISGLGAPKQKIVMTLPASAYRFTLENEDENAPRSATTEKEPVPIDREQLCEATNSGEWTVERDEDLTAPYAFQNKTWIAFEDKISVGIKGKYALLRDLAGLAVRNIENDVETECEEPLAQEIYRAFTEFKRKSRQAVLNALEDELHQMQFSYPNHAKTSSFRVVRAVDTDGHIRAVRENTQTEFVCKRQGYFVHPKSCNRFYRCVKFNQAVEDYSVFEFDCPAGLSFDERTEVCVWPGSLPEGSPCPGSSEIAPVAPKRFECSQPGYYADPQNCRWFFACMDLGGSELMAFEFRCPYGLVFDEQKLVCEWPWLVPACSGSGYARTEYNYGGYTAGASTGGGVGGYVTGGLPEHSVTEGADYNVDYSRTTGTGVRGPNYFGSTAGDIGRHPGASTPGAGTVSGHVGFSGPTGVGYSKSTEYGGAVSSGIQIGSVPPRTIVAEGGTGYSASTSQIGGTGYTVSDGFNTGRFGNTGSPGGITADFSESTSGEYSGTAGGSHLTQQGVTYSARPISGYPSSVAGGYTGSTTSPIIDTSYSRTSEGVGFSGSTSGEYSGTAGGSHLTQQGSARPISGYPSSVAGGYTGSTTSPIIDTSYSRTSGGVGFSGSTSGGYSGTAGGSHLRQQGVTYSAGPISSYPGGYTGSTTSPITDTGYSRTSEGVGFSGSSLDSHVGSASPKYVGSTNVYEGSSTHTDGYSASTGAYSGATGHQPSFGQTGPPFGSVSYPGATGNVDVTGSTNRQYAGSTAYGQSTGAEYSKGTGGISSTESTINLSTSSGIGSNLYGTTGSGRVPGTDFISGVPSSELGTSGVSTVSGHVSITSRPTGASSTGYKYNSEEGYTVPVFIQHEEPIYPSVGTTGAGVRGQVPTGTGGVGLTGGYGKTDFARPNLNISIYGNEIPTGYNVQTGTTGAIQPGTSVDGSIITSDSFTGTVFSHGHVPGAVSTPAINQGGVLIGGGQPGYVATSSGTPGYAISDGVKTVDVGSASPGTLLYSTPSPAISISGPSTAGVHLKGDSTPGVVISGQTAPGVSLGGSIQSGLTIESSTHRPYDQSQSTYHGISGTPGGSITYSSSTPSEGLIPTAPHGYKTDEGRGTFSTAYDTNKYTENDILDYRPTGANLPDSIVPGGIPGSTFEGPSTPGYSSSKSAVFTPSGFTKTGPTRTGITTAVLGGGGSYSVSTGDRRPAYNPDNISEKAFAGNVAGYTKTSFTDGPSFTLTPPGYSSTAAPGGRVQSTTSGYSYPKPSVQFETNEATSSPRPVGSTGFNLPVTTPFFSRLPTSTVRPIIYTTEHPELYQTTLFESKKIPEAVSTIRPIIVPDYISPTTSPVSVFTDDRFTQRTGGSQTASASTSGFDSGVPFRQTDSSGPTGYSSSVGYLPAKSTGPGAIASTIKYDASTVTARPEPGITYKKPSSIPDVSYGGPSSFQTPTTFRPSSGYYPGQGFSTTPSSLGTTPGGGSPTNLGISRDKIDKLITNYDRGTVKYTPTVYDTYSSSGFDSTKKFTSSLSSSKVGSGFTRPSGILGPSTLSYEVTTKSPEGKGKVIIKWSDLHPLLLGKLGAECTCKADPFANLRGPVKKLIESSKGKVDLANYDSSEIYVDFGSSAENDYSTDYGRFPAQPFKISAPKTTSVSTGPPSASYLPATDARISANSNELRSGQRIGKKLQYEEEEEEEGNEDYDDDPDQIINGVTDCARPGLFRHPGLCNKFYACHWDQWKKKFTLHIFNCPVHLTFDSSAGACNWPSKGPACQANNLLV